jgi:UDPglucose 6-dehydrogenase
MKIGVIGLGAVGETVYTALKFYHKNVVGYDKYKQSDPFEELADTDALFLAVPTLGSNGRLNCLPIEENFDRLEKIKYSGVVVIKSTLSLGFVDKLNSRKLRIVFMPEFLHENARLQDFVSPRIVVISGKEEDVNFVMKNVFSWLDSKIPVFRLNHMSAAMTKLVLNACAATKISFANETRRICETHGVDAKIVMQILVAEGRAAPEYTDPTRGAFGGKCLPKDLDELINCSDKSILLKAVKETNEAVKKEQEKS